LEENVLYFYGALSPKRHGHIVNYFSVPLAFELPHLLIDLQQLPTSDRTYKNVRNIFLKYSDEEKSLRGDREAWKYRTFNLNKFLQLHIQKPTQVFPVVEIRLTDTPDNSLALKRMLKFIYNSFKLGINSSVDIAKTLINFEKYQIVLKNKNVAFEQALRIVSQDIVYESLTQKFRNKYLTFLKNCKLSFKDYPLFLDQGPSNYVPQSLRSIDLLRKIDQDKVNSTWTIPKGASFGFEFEFNSSIETKIIHQLTSRDYIEEGMTTEETGNKELRTISTQNLTFAFNQIDDGRNILGDSLRSIHSHSRFPIELFQKIPKQELDSWLGWMSDWIVATRARHRNSLYSFQTATQNRLRVDSPDSWLTENGLLRRGTMRSFIIDNFVDIEIRGLMTGQYKMTIMENDLLKLAMVILLDGINNPNLVHGLYVQRVAFEKYHPDRDFHKSINDYLVQIGQSPVSKEQLDHFYHMIKIPDLMILPLLNFEHLPFLSEFDIHRITGTRERWLSEVSEILKNNTLTENEQKEQFLTSLSDFTARSNLDQILYDSLLSYASSTDWTSLNLPHPKYRSDFLHKLLLLIDGGKQNTLPFEQLITEWRRRDSKTLKLALDPLNQKSKLVFINLLAKYESRTLVQNWKKMYGIIESDNLEEKQEGFTKPFLVDYLNKEEKIHEFDNLIIDVQRKNFSNSNLQLLVAKLFHSDNYLDSQLEILEKEIEEIWKNIPQNAKDHLLNARLGVALTAIKMKIEKQTMEEAFVELFDRSIEPIKGYQVDTVDQITEITNEVVDNNLIPALNSEHELVLFTKDLVARGLKTEGPVEIRLERLRKMLLVYLVANEFGIKETDMCVKTIQEFGWLLPSERIVKYMDHVRNLFNINWNGISVGGSVNQVYEAILPLIPLKSRINFYNTQATLWVGMIPHLKMADQLVNKKAIISYIQNKLVDENWVLQHQVIVTELWQEIMHTELPDNLLHQKNFSTLISCESSLN
jgi:hypothetical protein